MSKSSLELSSDISTPKDLAQEVYDHLEANTPSVSLPPLQVLNDFFGVLFYASLQTEEGQFIQVTVTFFDPKVGKTLARPEKPRDPLHHQWSYHRFKKSFPFEIGRLVKLSRAADPWSSSIAVYYDSKTKLRINGLIDQAIHLQSYLNFEDESGVDQPGLFQASIVGIGVISVRSKKAQIATLKQSTLISKYLNVLSKGPVSEIIEKIATNTDNELINKLRETESIDAEENLQKSKLAYRKAFQRLLNKIKGYHHGGAILITDDIFSNCLEVKYQLRYPRLKEAIKKLCLNVTREGLTVSDYGPEEGDGNELELYKIREARQSITKEIKGAIRFIASQTGVDGLVLMDINGVVRGFGAVIREVEPPEKIYIATTLIASTLKERESKDFGTRHRSMFTFCYNHLGSLGFVVSQDGDIRAIMRVGEKLVMWENIQTQINIRAFPPGKR